ASAAHLAAADPRVEKVCIWTPDKDLAQCVRGDRVVQIHRRTNLILNTEAVQKKFGVPPERIPDFLALVGDSADGYPGIDGIGEVGAARLIRQHGPIEDFAPQVLGERKEMALLFKKLATLRADAALFGTVDELEWHGPRPDFDRWAAQAGDVRLPTRARNAATSAPERR
ncbi:MAG TPA: 5'-3' exonuclease H3TH domain-containing protein, partial [Burkholderiales bacterium]